MKKCVCVCVCEVLVDIQQRTGYYGNLSRVCSTKYTNSYVIMLCV